MDFTIKEYVSDESWKFRVVGNCMDHSDWSYSDLSSLLVLFNDGFIITTTTITFSPITI